MNLNFYKGKRVFLTGHTGFKGMWLTLLLLKAGAEVTGFSLDAPTEGGQEALRRLVDKSPDAVFLDIILPKLDGCEVLRRLRETHPNLPVVMLSTAASDENIAFANANGALMFIQKPYADHEISAALAKMQQQVERQ